MPHNELFCAAALLVACSRPCLAQSAGVAGPPAPVRGFVGAGLLAGSTDASNRIRFPDDARERLWLIEFGAPVASRVSIGAELISLGTVTGGTSGNGFELREKQTEQLLQGVVRVRAAQGGRVALDVMASGGVLFQKRDTTFEVCYLAGPNAGCSNVVDDEGRHALALGAGIDVPIAVTSHIAVTPMMRIVALRRDDFEGANSLRHSSTRLVVGVSGRVGWAH
jgi:hypothetical protein